MTGIDHRSKRPSPAGAKTPASKLHGKDLKVKKLPKFSVPAGPLPCPPGCALVPADLLHQLQSEVSKTALPVLRQEAPEVQHAPRRKEPEVHAQREDSLPNLTHPHATPAVAAKAPKPRLKDGGARPIVIVKHAGVSTEDTADGLGPPGARHANVGRVDAVEEGTQTSPQESVQPAAPTAPQTVSPTAHGPHSGVQGNAGDENKAVPWQPPQPVVTPVGMAVFSAGPALPGSPDKMNSTDHGRFDLFGMDKFTAEKDRDRKRLQAQMLAEQIQEQRERKEEEFRRKRDEEMREERRLARELREIEERHRHEQAVLSGQADAQSEPTPKVPPGRGHGTGQVRRRKSSKDLACESPAGAGSYTQLRADSSAGPWVDGDERRRRRPRRRRREVESNGLVQDGSWASERDKRTWRDANLSHSMLPDGRDTHSRSPVPWLTASPQDGDQPDGLRPVLETEEMKRTEGRRRRRADRTSMEKRERGDSYDANDTWESAQNRRSHDQDMRARADVSASWQREEEDEQAKRRPGRVPMRRGEQLAAVAEVVESPRQKASQPPTSSDADLREQIQSLVKVCEQLLRERAEERGSRNPKGTPAGGASPNRKTQERPERQSPSPRRLPAVSKHEMIEESAKTGMSGAALGSARGASQASRASKNPTSTEWRTSQPHATPDAGGAPATGGASDMHTFGEAAAPVQPNASGSSNTRPAPADSLSELLQGQSRMIAASEIPEAYIVPYNAAYSAAPAAVAPVGHPDYSRPRPPGVLVEESPFASPARGIAVRRSSRSYRRDSYGGWGGRMLASPPLISRGGLNVQANWEPLGVEGGGHPFPFHKGSRRSRGPGQVPIGINPSIQAQSAMLREMYPNVAMGGGGAGPFSRA